MKRAHNDSEHAATIMSHVVNELKKFVQLAAKELSPIQMKRNALSVI